MTKLLHKKFIVFIALIIVFVFMLNTNISFARKISFGLHDGLIGTLLEGEDDNQENDYPPENNDPENDDKPEEVDFYIAYEANVKVGIQMGEVKFDIDEDNKTVKPLLPELSVNIVTPNTESLSYIPKDPDIPLKEIIALCEKDAMNEANNSEELYETAEQNLQAVIEALLSPILDHAEYSVVW